VRSKIATDCYVAPLTVFYSEFVMKNPVAKNARRFNKAVVMVDRKKAAKRGYNKHKSYNKIF